MDVVAAPASFAQQGLWYQAELEPGNPAYHVPVALSLRGSIDRSALAAAFNAISERHEILRTTFALEGAELTQIIHPVAALPFRCEAVGRDDLLARIREEIHQPFDLKRGPLLRSVLLELADDEAVLLITMHHLVTDGWSLGVMVRELAAFYRRFSGELAEPLDELEIQYADFAEWQREQASGNSWDSQLAFWKEKLRGPLGRPELPPDFARPSTHAFAGATETFRIAGETVDALHELSRQNGTTLFMTLLAAFKVLLYRHSGVTDVVVGSPVAGRSSAAVEDLVGFFVNTQVLRTSLEGNPSFLDVLARVRETTLGAWENQDVPFELLTSVLQPERRRTSNPFFDVMFALQNAPTGRLELPGVDAERFDVVTDTAKLALTMITEEIDGELEVRMEYSAALYVPATIRRIGARYERLLQAICKDASCAIDRIPMLPDEERAEIERWGSAREHFDSTEPLHRWFERQVAGTPQRVAVTFDDTALTYDELNRRANQLAHHLQSHGVGPETLVGLCLDRSLDLIVGILAILKAGGAYVPLDPSYPENRLRFVVEDSQATVVVTSSLFESQVRSAPRLVLLDRDAAAIAARPETNSTLSAESGQAAYVIYTSGSTGNPKGVVVTHANVARLMSSTESLFAFGPDDVWTLFHSYAFDFSVWEIWGALLYGGRLVVVPYEASRTPEQFHRLLTDECVTVLNQTPSAFYQLMGFDAPPSLRYVIFGGEALDVQRLHGWFELHGDDRPQLVNMYGITETTVHVTWHRVRMADLTQGLTSVIGVPLPDLSATVVDAAGEVVPVGVAGELYVGGDGVARGYLRRDELTAARFLDGDTGRHYRSGDSVRWAANGELEYLGRIDTQVKIRGFRIELGEIEHVLRSCDGVADAVVVARPGPSDQQRLVAYFVQSQNGTATPDTLRSSSQLQLPEFMVPSAYVMVGSFPLNANGKLDREALPDPDLDADVVHETYVAPTNETEATLARIWGEVLQVERVGIADNFFALGGDSILLLQIAAKSAKAGLKLTRRNLVEFQTIQELAAVVMRANPPAAPAPPVVSPVAEAVDASEWEAVYALTPLQQGLLFHSVDAPQKDFYLEQLHAVVHGPLDLAAFEKAWQTVIARHAVLRTSFDWSAAEEPRQRVSRTVPFAVVCEDWRELDAEQQAERFSARLAEDRSRPFDLAAAPLMRVALFRLAEDRWHWLWTHHHLILDGWSLTAVVGEVLGCYGAYSTGAEPSLSTRRPFHDYIAWLGEQDQNEAEAFWRDALDGFAEPTGVEALQHSGAVSDGSGEIEIELAEPDTARLQEWARHHQLTLSTVVTAAWAKLLQTYAGTDDVVFGVTVSGRPAELAGYDQMVGPFINTLPLRVRSDGGAEFEEWLRRLQKQHGRMREFEFSRLVDIQRWSGVPAGQTLFETMVVFENYPVDESLRDQSSGLSFGPVTFVERGHYGLALAAIPGQRLALRLYFDQARFDGDAMHRLLGQLRTLLAHAGSGEVKTAGEWTPLTVEERKRLQSTHTPHLDRRSPHELFEAAAAANPEQVALVFGDVAVSYGELDRRANQLAHLLQRRGVAPDSVVAIKLPRSIEFIVAVLAVWKAGGAWLPLDPAYPKRRLAQMIDDSGAVLILSGNDIAAASVESTEAPSSDAGSGNLAYVIYTSGSTGLPKGTLVERGGVTNLAHALAGILTIDRDSRVLQFASMSFDVAVSEIVMALCFGATLHLATRDELLPGPELSALLRDRRITHLSIVPSALAAVPPIALPDLRCLVVGGEPCPAGLLEQWSSGRQIFNCYGPTEATVCATWSEYTGGKLTIGRPIANVRTYVLDRNGAALPAGAPGELHIGGAGVARGYLGRSELTAERFVRDPFSSEPDARLYRTGDLVRQLSSGELEFLGRLDDQVKVRGFRIEPEEIAHVLRERGGLRDAAVVVRSGRLVAYCVASGETTPRQLRETCAAWLPEHMVPSVYLFVDSLPYTPSGKLDKEALPDPDLDRDLARDSFVAPSSDAEVALANAWSEVLGVPRVGASDNFFELGGDSILTLQVVARARQAGLQITPRQLFQHPTVAGLARVARVDGVTRVAGEDLARAPLTPIQRWFFEQELTHRNQWNQAVLVEVAPSVSSATLAEAIAALAQHHDAFRSRFTRSEQTFASHGVIAFESVALPADIEKVASAAHSALDLENGPLARAIHFSGGERSLLLLVAHHLIVDGVSWRVLLGDLARLCVGERPEPAISFGQWAQHLYSTAKTTPVDVDYWLELTGSEFRPLPVDTPRDQAVNRAGSIDIVELRLDAEKTGALLRSVPAAYRTQVNDALLAAFATAMHAWTRDAALWVNLEGHGREPLFEEIDLSRTVGWFTSLFPVRLELGAFGDPGAVLRSVKEQLRAIPQNGVTFGIARHLRNDERLASLPHPEISFNYLGQFDQAQAEAGVFRLADGPVGKGQHDDERRVHLIDVVASVQSHELRVAWHYSTTLHRRATIERLANEFIAALCDLIDRGVRLTGSNAEVADIYGLTPMQQGLLFHSIESAQPDLYVEQLHCELRGNLDADAFERAWQEVIRRHDVFRTSFVWQGLDEPLLRVQREIAFRVDVHDWRDAADQGQRVADYLSSDRQRGLALDAAPLFRVALLRLADDRWQFVWTHHHILLDGWCMNLVVREVLDCYEALTKGMRAPARPSRPFRDYVEWLGKQDETAARKYWSRALGGFTEPTRLQLLERSSSSDDDSGQAELALSALETRRLQSWARRNRITLSTVVAGAWARLLQSYSGSRDVVFGITVAGRPASLAGSDSMIGLFINTLPLRVGDAEGVPLVEWLQNVQSRQTELREFEFSRLVDVQRCSDVAAGEPLFETLLAFDNYPADRSLEQRFGELEIHGAHLAERTHYALALSVAPADELRLRALYDSDRFAGAAVRQLLDGLKALLLAAASDQVRTAGDWNMLTADARQSLLRATPAPPVRDECLGAWFSRTAANNPHAVAVSFEGRQVTYEQLEQRSNQIARHLQAQGVRAETLVGLCLERSADLIAGILGILKAGGAYVPLDPSNPVDRLRFIAADSGVRIVITHSATAAIEGSLRESGAAIISLDAAAGAIERESTEAPVPAVTPGNAAYVIYTSGSTGRPKGCVVTHANVSRLMKQTESSFGFDDSDVWTLFHSAAFDFSVWEIWGALLYGGRLVVVPYAVSRSPEQFYELVRSERVTVLNQTPSAFRQLMTVDESVRAELSLRYVIFGGEALQFDSLRGWFDRHGDQTPLLVNMYGITETTVHVTFRPVRVEDLGNGSRIGAPIADLQLYVVDPYQQLVPDGVVGELYVAGAGVSRGYLGHPELTSQRMIPNPFGPGRLYRTGDLARRRGEDLEYLGRADDQVKVRGFRIETGEIEAVLAQHPAVREAVVMLRDGSDGKRLVAYVVGREAVSADQLRSFLAERIPDYMIPAAFAFPDAMPLTSNGKINRAALPEPSSRPQSAYAVPRSDAERVLAEVWGEVLGVERVGIHDNFFALGGDSIRSIQILSKARARGFDYSFQELFARPTIAALAGGSSSEDADVPATEPLGLISDGDRAQLPSGVEDAYPLTRLQQGMFFHSDFESGATTYHDVMSYHLRARYDSGSFAAALATVTRRHAILRTSFDFVSFSEPMQLVHRDATVPVDETDLRGAEDPDRLIRAWIELERRQPFIADAAPLLRVHVHRRTDETFQLSLSFHHAILDGWSVATLLSELFRAYLELPLPEPAQASFREFVALERRAVADDDERAFWSDFLADLPAAGLPRLRAAGEARAIGRQQIEVGQDISRAIKELADQAGVPLRSVLLAAHVRALSHILNEEDVVTGLVTNGRPEDPDGDRVLGLFLNTIPFRMRLGAGSWIDLVRETFATEQRLNAHRRYPLADIQKVAGGSPLFDTDFNFVHFHVLDEIAALGGVQSLGAEGFEETNFALAVNFSWWGSPGRLAAALDYDASLLTEDQARGYARAYGSILTAIARTPGARYDAHSLTPPPIAHVDRVEIPSVALHELVAWSAGVSARGCRASSPGNGPAAQEPSSAGRSPAAGEDARTPPDLVAVRSADGAALTYEQLHRRSNQLANALRRRGVGADVLVGVALPPGAERVVALLGVLKAGGAYLPLDPDQPSTRLQIMIADSAIDHVVTSRGAFNGDVAHIFDVGSVEASEDDPAVAVDPQNLAYALYTSGSTGMPKGVLISHRALVNHMLWMQRTYPLTTADVVFQKTPFTFDASVWEFWAPLIAGASMVVAEAGGLQDAAYLAETIRRHGVTILQVVPTLLESLLCEPSFGSCRSLRRVFAGGEALSSDLVRRFHETLPDAELVNLYGPTESTIDATSHLFSRSSHEEFVPIGRPVANTAAYVLDARLQSVPAGTEGDLYLAGEGLARGYLNRAAMTASSFLPDPYGAPGMRMYRTGDRARWLSDGTLEFRGRADQQLKVRGHRVEAGEVEAALSSHDAVERAIATVVDNRLVAYVVALRPVDSAELRAHVRALLPEAMVPSLFVMMDRLPLTSSGKVDRKALPLPLAGDVASHAAFVAPVTDAETAVAGAWETVLAAGRVGLHDNFFELGGDSILSLRIASRLRSDGWKVSPKQILQQQTVARVAAQAERVGVAIEEIATTGPVPLSPIQREFFALDLPRPHHWNQSVVLKAPSDFSPDAFRAALRALAQHHDVFRLRFRRSEDGWRQEYVSAAAEIPLDATSDFEAVQASLDLARGPLMRAAHSGEDLLLTAHHLVVDGVSWRIIFEDLEAAYAQALRGDPIALPGRTASFGSWVKGLQARAASADPSHWIQLAAVEAPRLPVVAESNREADARSVVTRLDVRETQHLIHEAPRRTRARLHELLLAALTETITRWTGADTLWLDVEGHGREDLLEDLDVSRTVGWFTSVFPVALVRSESAPAALLRTIKEQWRAVAGHGVEFGVLRHLSDDASIRERLGALPPRQISFNYLGRFDGAGAGAFRPSSRPGGADHDPLAPRSYLLDVNARVVNGQLSVEWTHAGGAFDAETIDALSTAFVENLRRIADAGPAARVVSDFPLAGLDAQGLEALAGGIDSVEEIFPLSPLQEGLLFHALDDEQPGIYLQQITAVLDGNPEPRAFARAWNRAIERHAVLRTSFHRRDLQRPLQVVHQQAPCTPVWLDWRALSDDACEAAWEGLLREDRRAGIDLQQPPLMRITVVREKERRSRLLFTHHHLLLDGWSLPIVMGDVVAFYREESEGAAPQLAPAPPYSEFIGWLERGDRAGAESFWRETLKDFDEPNEIALPTPTQPAAAAFDAAERVFSDTFTARLGSVAQSLHVTLNSVVQAMWAVLVSAYSRRDDVVFGVTVSGRPPELAGIERTAGLFINTLPLRVEVRPAQRVVDLLQDVQRRQASISQFEFSPLVDVQRCSDIRSGQPLFESIFIFENYPLGESLEQSPLADFSVRDAQSVEWTHYPLTCLVTPSRELRLRIVYDTTRFERLAIDRMLEHAETLLDAFVAEPSTPVGDIALTQAPLTTPASDRGFDGFFHERFAAQAARTPEACAIVVGDRTLTYRELDERSSRLAGHLRAKGLGSERIAALFMDRSPEMMVALLAIMKAGGAYLPLDPRFPAERLEMMVADAAPLLIVTQDQLVSRLPRHDAQVVAVDSTLAAIENDPSQPPEVTLVPENLAYVIFTSGSTGRPKGVQIPHRALANLLQSFASSPGMKSTDVMLAVTTLSFDIAALELFLPLMCGAKLVIATAEDAADGDRLSALLADHAVTVMQATPATWRLLLLNGWTPPPSLRIWCGGEAMPADLAGELLVNGSQLWNVYGPTETTIWSATHAVMGSSDARVLGGAVANTTLHVVDRYLKPVPTGVPGELLIGGDGVARGYRNRAALTAERFVPDPFSATPGARAYLTGDQVRLRADGSLEFLGREDAQVKVRGFRVELGDIEAAVRELEGVRDCVVVFSDSRLVGYVVRDRKGDVVDALRRKLPDYMVPGVWIDLDELPLTPNGKLDRRALPRPGAAADDATFVRPRTAIEEVLAEVWKETLGLEDVGIHDSFFALGGHSLHAAQIVAWLRRTFRTRIALRMVFEANTIERLAAVLSGESASAEKTAGVLLQIRRMPAEERARRIAQRQQAQRADVLE